MGPLSYVFENQVGQFFLRVIVGAEDEVVVAKAVAASSHLRQGAGFVGELVQKAFSLNH